MATAISRRVRSRRRVPVRKATAGIRGVRTAVVVAIN